MDQTTKSERIMAAIAFGFLLHGHQDGDRDKVQHMRANIARWQDEVERRVTLRKASGRCSI